ncbi:hypothetical protein J6500_09475 [Bradyrhizobium sp. WSM 1704]|nr:hypothetical protein [Bradyrhizobium semiaridum]
MPWKSNTVLETRSEFIRLTLAPNANIQSLCRRFNISRQTGYRTLERDRIAGARGLESQSRRPHHTPHRCPGRSSRARRLPNLGRAKNSFPSAISGLRRSAGGINHHSDLGAP